MESMLDTVPLPVLVRLPRGLVPGIFGRAALLFGAHLMVGFQGGLLRIVTPQLFAQFSRVIHVNLRIVEAA